MKPTLICSLLILGCVAAHVPRHMMDNDDADLNLVRSGDSQYPHAKYYQVDVDHFDGSNPNVWNQPYYVNDTFWTPGSDAPIMLCVGGEGPPLDGSVVVSSVHCNNVVEWLQETKALMFAVEHRYYSCHNMSACPVSDLSAPGALKYLSSRQALGDLVAFHAYASREYGLTSANKWVTWGGSYPGMLASWARLKFPNLFHASVSSSAPVRAEFIMPGYNNVNGVAYSVSDNLVGGSPQCMQAIASGHATIGEMLGTRQGQVKLVEVFNLPSVEWISEPSNQEAFAGYGVASFPAQSNDPLCTQPACNIAKICAIMLNDTYPAGYLRLATLRQIQQNAGLLDTPAEASASQQRRFFSTDLQKARQAAKAGATFKGGLDDLWLYQTCTEFGFYLSCDVGSECIFTQGLEDIDSQMSFCTNYWNISKDQVQLNINYTNQYYGSDQPAGSRVMYINGEVDPWSSNSVLQSPDPVAFPTLMVPGASHHAWTHPSSDVSQDSVRTARTLIRKQVTEWLKQD